MRGVIRIIMVAAVVLAISAALPLAMADKPAYTAINYPQTVWSDPGIRGSVTGMVTTSANGTGAGGAYIAVVDASNLSREYYNTTSDKDGNYQITGLNATYSSTLQEGPDGSAGSFLQGMNMYRIYANKSPYGEGYSGAFGIDANESFPTTSVILTRPAKIELKAERGHITDDEFDNIRILAYLYDSSGNPVADGYRINFTIGNVTSNAYREGGFPQYDAMANGSFAGSRDSTNLTEGGTGSASAWFGWVTCGYGGNNSTIWAYYADDASVSGSTKIYMADPTDSLAGCVVDSSGTAYGGIPVTLHVMRYDPATSTPVEIYNMTRTTRNKPFAGLFSFDYIYMNDVAYCYADASVRLADNLTVYGKSDNFSMNRPVNSTWSMPNIAVVLQIPTPTPAPTATPAAGNGIVAGLVIVIAVIIACRAYSMSKK